MDEAKAEKPKVGAMVNAIQVVTMAAITDADLAVVPMVELMNDSSGS
jgi:hypothetical protein